MNSQFAKMLWQKAELEQDSFRGKKCLLKTLTELHYKYRTWTINPAKLKYASLTFLFLTAHTHKPETFAN